MKNDFEIMSEMSKNNMDIACATELVNFQRQEKKGGGTVTVGVASPHFDHLINQAATGNITHYAVLYIVNKEQYNKIKNAPPPGPFCECGTKSDDLDINGRCPQCGKKLQVRIIKAESHE